MEGPAISEPSADIPIPTLPYLIDWQASLCLRTVRYKDENIRIITKIIIRYPSIGLVPGSMLMLLDFILPDDLLYLMVFTTSPSFFGVIYFFLTITITISITIRRTPIVKYNFVFGSIQLEKL